MYNGNLNCQCTCVCLEAVNNYSCEMNCTTFQFLYNIIVSIDAVDGFWFMNEAHQCVLPAIKR